jgi:hypothetical protein
MSFESAFDPENPRNQATHLKEGFVMGWVPGTITSIDDLEKINRVRVKCPLLDENSDLPNNEDYYVWVMEEFTESEVAGGSYRNLRVGSQVALLPMLGDPTQMLLIGCLNSRVDRPHPDFDRAKGTYGTASSLGDIEYRNDKDGTRVNRFRTGISESYTKTGNYHIETRDDAVLSLSREGDVTIGNPKTSAQFGKEGNASVQSDAGSRLTLSNRGEALLASLQGSNLSLVKDNAQLKGPDRRFAIALQKLQRFLSADLIGAQNLIRQLCVLEERFKEGEIQASTFVSQIAITTNQISTGVAQNIPQSISALQELKELLPIAVRDVVIPQLKYAEEIDLPQIVSHVESIQVDDASQTIEALIQNLPSRIESNLGLEKQNALKSHLRSLVPHLAALSYDKTLQRNLLVAEILPGGWDSVSLIFSLGLESRVLNLEQTVNPNADLLPSATLSQEKDWFKNIEEWVEAGKQVLPTDIEFGATEIFELLPPDETLSEELFFTNYSDHLRRSRPQTDEERQAEKERQLREGSELIRTAAEQLVPGESILPLLLGDLLHKRIQKVIQQLEPLQESNEIAKMSAHLYPVAYALSSPDVLTDDSELKRAVAEASDYFNWNPEVEDLVSVTTQDYLPGAISKLKEELVPILQSVTQDFSTLLNTIPPLNGGAGLVAGAESTQMQTPQGNSGAITRVGQGGAEMWGPQLGIDPATRTAIFAEKADVGLKAGDLGGAVHATRLGSEMLGAERDEVLVPEREEDSPEATPKKAGYGIYSKGSHLNKGGDRSDPQVKPDYSQQSEVDRKVRSSIFADPYGGAGMRSGGLGAVSYVHREKAGTVGPEVEVDGKKLRTSTFNFATEVGFAVGEDGGSSYAGLFRTEVLSPVRGDKEIPPEEDQIPESDAGGLDIKALKRPIKLSKGGKKNILELSVQGTEKLRAALFAEKDGFAGVKSGGLGAQMFVSEASSQIFGPEINGDRTFLFAYPDEAGIESPSGGLMYVGKEIAEVLGPLLGDKARTSIWADAAEVVMLGGGVNGAITKVSEEIFKAIGPDGKKLLEISKQVLKAIGGNGGSVLQLADNIAELLGPDGKKALKIGMQAVELLGSGASGLKLLEQGLEILGIDGSTGIKVFEGVTSLLGGGGVSMSISPQGIRSQGFGGGGISLTPDQSVVASVGKTIFRSGDATGSKGAGVVLNGQDGSAAIASFYPGEWNIISEDQEASGELGNEQYRIMADDNGIKLQALSTGGGVLQEITMDRERIQINGMDMSSVSELIGLIPGLVERVAEIDQQLSESEG